MQIIRFMRVREDRDAAAFQSWYLNRNAPQLVETHPEIQQYIVNLAQDGPKELRRPTDSSDPRSRYDLVTQMWLADIAVARSARQAETDLTAWIDQEHAYVVSETVVMDKRPPQSAMSAGIKVMRGMYFFEDMPDSAARRSWSVHATLALKVHLGMSRYAQYWVEKSLSPNDPAVRGISELYFPSREDLIERYYESSRGRDEIAQDSAHFIRDQLPRVYAVEYVVKPHGG